MSSQPTIALFPEPGAWGPTNNLVAIGNHLTGRGIRTVFVVEESFEGELASRGFDERLMRLAPPPEHQEAVDEGWAEFVRITSPEFRKPTLLQLETVTAPIWAEFVEGANTRTSGSPRSGPNCSPTRSCSTVSPASRRCRWPAVRGPGWFPPIRWS
jgi:UDP:flavonoid glycosyltransferase YjiC (YdhE family)